jgi:CO/xanthine dehydrogenase FAD-binding subunit
MKPFDFIVAHDSDEALAVLARIGAGARLLAGGTDLLVELKAAARAPAVVVDISRASDLTRIAMTEEGLVIGAAVTHGEILDSPLIRRWAPAVADACHSIGAVQTRSLGTLGGNLVTCVPSMDGGPVLVALDALVTIAGAVARRRIALEEFFVAPRRTALRPDELLLEIVIPKKSLGKPADFQKFGLRKGQALALVNVAASFRVGEPRATFVEPRIALGAVAPTVMRAAQAEAFLEGRTISLEAMREAGRIAAAEARPITDFRASAEYRRDLIAVLTRRALENARARAQEA